jgi:valyl-tRNA synthetase
MVLLQETVRVIRNLRVEAGLSPQQFANNVYIQTENEEYADIMAANMPTLVMLCKVNDIEFIKPDIGKDKTARCLSGVTTFAEISLFVGDILDIDAEIQRLEKDMEILRKNLITNNAKLRNESFVSRAPAEVVEQERQRKAEAETQIERIIRNIDNLKRS